MEITGKCCCKPYTRVGANADNAPGNLQTLMDKRAILPFFCYYSEWVRGITPLKLSLPSHLSACARGAPLRLNIRLRATVKPTRQSRIASDWRFALAMICARTQERQPDWCENAEPIVAKALAEEVRRNKLFNRVKIHADNVNPKKFSQSVQFRVKKFECVSKTSFLESAGRTALEMQGIRGALIARSIPRKYTAEVEIEFEVLDVSTQQPIFDKSYSASGVVTLNGYQSDKPLVQQMSASLETVLTQFILDLTQNPAIEH